MRGLATFLARQRRIKNPASGCIPGGGGFALPPVWPAPTCIPPLAARRKPAISSAVLPEAGGLGFLFHSLIHLQASA